MTCSNDKSVDPIDEEKTTIDLVQVDVKFPPAGGCSLSIRFNDKSYFFVVYHELQTPDPILWDNHFVTYLPRGENNVTLGKLNFKYNPDSSVTYNQNFNLGDAEKYTLFFQESEGKLDVMVY